MSSLRGDLCGRSWAGAALWLLGLVLLGLGAPARASAEEYASAAAAAQKGLVHRALHARTRAWRALAETGDARALALLVSAYDRSSEHPNGRALLASIACSAFGAHEHLPALAAWRAAHDGEEHLWLWYRTLCCEVAAGEPAGTLALAGPGHPVWQRAAALEALAAGPGAAALALLADEPAALSADPLERTLVLEALSHVWAANAARLGSPEHRAAGVWLAAQLDRPETPARARHTLLRDLGRVLRPAVSFEEGAFWHNLLLAQAAAPSDERAYAPPPKTRFLDLVGSGQRVAYVLDCSGSMAEPLTPVERADLRRLAAPAPAAAARTAQLPARKGPAPKDVWEGVDRRIEAAVALMRLSLRSLPKEARFTVVLFGSKHAYLGSTPGLVEASRANVSKAIKDLDQVIVGSASPLGGGTNLHGGLARALQTLEAGATRHANGFEDLLRGADTVFLLSDGSPGEDDWSDEDPTRRRLTTFDPHAEQGTFYDPAQLLDDAARLNLLRRCEIHCLGIGAADGAAASEQSARLGALLERLATLGHGRYRAIPLPPTEPAPEIEAARQPGR